MMDMKKIDDAIAYSVEVIEKAIPDFTDLFPEEQSKNLIYPARKICSWTESFWTGMLWLSYELTGKKIFKETAEFQLEAFRDRIDTRTNIDTHDLGFLYSLSAVAQYKLTGNEEAKRVALTAADTLTERYHEKGQFIQAWGKIGAPDNYRFIIDCLLNLPLLYWASEVSGDQKYYNIAYNHLKTALSTVTREDGSTYHTVFFDPQTGKKLKGVTHQGYADDSSWARGQAWGVYGTALSFDYTKDESIIPEYKRITDYFIAHLPKDYVPFWDLIFTDGDDMPRDSSSGAIAVCGMLEMDKYIHEPKYMESAEKILNSLIDNYMTKGKVSNGLLTDGMYNWNNGDKPECNIWGDYFFLEALMRIKNPDWKMYW